MGNPKIELKITIGEAERLTVTGKNLEKLTGRRLRALNINLQRKIKEERAKAIRIERQKQADIRKKEQEVQEREATVEAQAQEEAAKAKRVFKLSMEYARVVKEVNAGTASDTDESRKVEIEKELRTLPGGKKVLDKYKPASGEDNIEDTPPDDEKTSNEE